MTTEFEKLETELNGIIGRLSMSYYQDDNYKKAHSDLTKWAFKFSQAIAYLDTQEETSINE
jgi:hypothetical protein